jgi:primosomal protein N' (replication factor Y) (superfamily II helicase)
MTSSDLFLQERKILSVLPAAYIDRPYSYAVPEHIQSPLQKGSIVHIPLNNRLVPGVVWDDEPGEIKKTAKLKDIASTLDARPLTTQHLEFIQRLADYTLSPLGSALKMTLSSPHIFEEEPEITVYAAILQDEMPSLSVKHQRVFSFLLEHGPHIAAEIAEAANVSTAILKTMVKNGIIEKKSLLPSPPCHAPDPTRASIGLTPEQHEAASSIIKDIQSHEFSSTLLDGVTGSGKTEVYFEAVAEALREDKQVLILLPEIALSNAFLDRFEKRFGCKPGLWHSSVTAARRRRTWKGVLNNQTKVIIGARSALMLPFQSLGLIIVDEEHDPAFKQEEQVIYHARDMAVLRAHLEKCPIALISATPSLETMHNVWTGRYKNLELPARYGGAQLPDIHIIDMREHKPPVAQEFLSAPLKAALHETYDKGEQSLLFLNRRGYAPLTICRDCGHRIECPNCTAWLVEHKDHEHLLCHHCGYHALSPTACPSCGAENSMAACGPGVERIAEETKKEFPDARIEILSSDSHETQEELLAALDKIKNHKVDIIIGTQIIAKGHHFPKLTCVGIVDADIGLDGGDLRATEKTYQLLHQVTGRAGREAKDDEQAGQVYLQTWMADNPVIQALAGGHRDAFFEAELLSRQHAHMPPFSRLVGLIVSSAHQEQALQTARLLAQTAPASEEVTVLGPAPAPLSKLRGKYRYRLLVIANKTLNVQKTISHWLQHVKHPSTTRIQIDIDPYNFL